MPAGVLPASPPPIRKQADALLLCPVPASTKTHAARSLREQSVQAQGPTPLSLNKAVATAPLSEVGGMRELPRETKGEALPAAPSKILYAARNGPRKETLSHERANKTRATKPSSLNPAQPERQRKLVSMLRDWRGPGQWARLVHGHGQLKYRHIVLLSYTSRSATKGNAQPKPPAPLSIRMEEVPSGPRGACFN